MDARRACCFASLLPSLLLLFPPPVTHAHARWKCPFPRSADTGIKSGPCGAQTNDFSLTEPIREIAPGPMRVAWEESVFHTGAPFRIALSRDGTDDAPCVLLDHIPHNDNPPALPNLYNESLYIPYFVTIEIPDIFCDRCSLHLANPMTDKIGSDGSPNGVGCTDPFGTCFSVYYSCTIPFRITGSNAEWDCPALPDDWPLDWISDGGVPLSASEPGVYRREAGDWDDGLLQTAPEKYRADEGICGSQSTTLPVTPTTPPESAHPAVEKAPALPPLPQTSPPSVFESTAPSGPKSAALTYKFVSSAVLAVGATVLLCSEW